MAIPGNDADIAIALQASKGTPSSASSQRLYLMSGGISGTKDIADVEETASGRLRGTSYVGGVSGGGSVTFAVRPASIGLLLYGAMGAKAVSGSEDPYEHTITLAPTLPWFTIWRRISSSLFERISDAKIGRLVLRSQAGGLLAAEVTWAGLTPAHKTAAESTATPEDSSLVFVHHFGQGALLYEGAAAAEIGRCSLDINNNLQVIRGDAITGYDAAEQVQEITLETEHTVSNFDMYRRWMYGASSPSNNASPSQVPLELAGDPAGIDFKWTRPGSPERSIEILAPRVQVVTPGNSEPNASGAPITETRTHKVYKPASGSGLTAIVTNGQSAYATS